MKRLKLFAIALMAIPLILFVIFGIPQLLSAGEFDILWFALGLISMSLGAVLFIISLLEKPDNQMACKQHKYQLADRQQYYYWSGRYSKTYVSITTLFCEKCANLHSETQTAHINEGREYQLPDWAKPITDRRRDLESL